MWFYYPNHLIVLEKERIQHEDRKINSPIKKETTQETHNKKNQNWHIDWLSIQMKLRNLTNYAVIVERQNQNEWNNIWDLNLI